MVLLHILIWFPVVSCTMQTLTPKPKNEVLYCIHLKLTEIIPIGSGSNIEHGADIGDGCVVGVGVATFVEAAVGEDAQAVVNGLRTVISTMTCMYVRMYDVCNFECVAPTPSLESSGISVLQLTFAKLRFTDSRACCSNALDFGYYCGTP